MESQILVKASVFDTIVKVNTDIKTETVVPDDPNKPPVAKAGFDQTIKLPANSLTLSGSGGDEDGVIVGYLWEKIKGNDVSISTPTSPSTSVSGFTAGEYVFRLTVIDDKGASGFDDVSVTVEKEDDSNPPSEVVRENLVYEDDFERPNPEDRYKDQQQWCCAHSITSETEIVRKGTRSVKMYHKRTDNVSSGYRVEFQSDKYFPRLPEAWYGYSVYFKDWESFNGGEHIMQWHPTIGGGSASLAIYTEAQTFHVRLNPEGDSTANTLKNSMKIQSNKWYDFVWHVKWDSRDGIVQLWINGELYVDYVGPTLTKGGIPYFKYGINRWSWTGRAPSVDRTMYCDELRIGNENATYKDVAP